MNPEPQRALSTLRRRPFGQEKSLDDCSWNENQGLLLAADTHERYVCQTTFRAWRTYLREHLVSPDSFLMFAANPVLTPNGLKAAGAVVSSPLLRSVATGFIFLLAPG